MECRCEENGITRLVGPMACGWLLLDGPYIYLLLIVNNPASVERRVYHRAIITMLSRSPSLLELGG